MLELYCVYIKYLPNKQCFITAYRLQLWRKNCNRVRSACLNNTNFSSTAKFDSNK